jgi:hypothetical protein
LPPSGHAANTLARSIACNHAPDGNSFFCGRSSLQLSNGLKMVW